jgi:DNA-binding winged helix-turn-helix (wHTH) protein
MDPKEDSVYEFAGFVLRPSERQLTRFDRQIPLTGKSFDVLIYFVEHADDLVRGKQVVHAVWGEDAVMDESNLRHHLGKIRKALGDDAVNPRFLKTYHGRGAYRFITPVTRSNSVSIGRSPIATKRLGNKITAHLFVPIICGRATYKKLHVPKIETQWATYKEFVIDNGRLCLHENGVGVWHLTETHTFETLVEAATWRKETYERILTDSHRISIYNKQVFASLEDDEERIFGDRYRQPGYVFSLLVLNKPAKSSDRSGKVLEILASLTSLESAGDKSERDLIERRLLDGQTNVEIREFGSAGQDIGFATWDSLSYCAQNGRATDLLNDIIEFEIAVQATWWLAKCLNDAAIEQLSDELDHLRPFTSSLKRQYGRLENIAAMETIGVRTMIEAVLDTSRLPQLVEETFRLSNG